MPPRKRQRPHPATLSSSSLPTTALSPETSLSLASSASAQQASDQKRPPQAGSSSDHKPSDASLRVKEVQKIPLLFIFSSGREPLDLDGQALTERNRFGKPTAGTQRGRNPQRPRPRRRSLGRIFWEILLDPGTHPISLDSTRSEAKTTHISPTAPTQLRHLHRFRPSRAVHLQTRKLKRISHQNLYVPEIEPPGLRDLLRKCPRFPKQSRLLSSSNPRSPSLLRSRSLGWRPLQAKVYKQPMLQMLHRNMQPRQGGSAAGGLKLHLPNLLLSRRQIPKR